jgi:dTDP-4-amino-4,6-dideoxygalactose transaminase
VENNVIPFNQPFSSEVELAYIKTALESNHLSGDGQFTKNCNQWLVEKTSAGKAMLTTSCTHALEMSALLLGIQPGDEVIVPSYTFVSTANAFVLRGASPVFIDVRPDTLNINEKLIEKQISDLTKAIIVVHYAGVGCEMDEITRIAQKHNLPVIEDNAQGLMGEYRRKPLGSFGTFAAQSFHETKNLHCGEGGALLINEPRFFDRAEILREKGTNRNRFFRGQVDKYTWVDIGSSYLPSEILAAFLWAQFQNFSDIYMKRAQIWENYYNLLKPWADENGIGLPTIPGHCEQTYHLFYLMLPSLQQRHAFIEHLKTENINAVFHYQALHLSEMGKRYGGKPGTLPVSEKASDCLVRLPFYYALTEEHQERVVSTVTRFRVRGDN